MIEGELSRKGTTKRAYGHCKRICISDFGLYTKAKTGKRAFHIVDQRQRSRLIFDARRPEKGKYDSASSRDQDHNSASSLDIRLRVAGHGSENDELSIKIQARSTYLEMIEQPSFDRTWLRLSKSAQRSTDPPSF